MKTKLQDNATNLLFVIITSVIVPLISHLLDLIYGSEKNPWGTEKLFVLYFSIVIVHTIINKIIQMLKKHGLYEKGFKIGDSYAMEFSATLAISMCVIYGYDLILGSVILLILFIIGAVIIWRDLSSLALLPTSLIVFGIIMALNIGMFSLFPFESGETRWMEYSLRLLIGQLCVCVIWDLLAKGFLKKKDCNNKK